MTATRINGADYVIDEGADGIWHWRKWASGIAECWGIYRASIAVNTASAGYGGYRSGQIAMPEYPIAFIEPPAISLVGGAGCTGTWVNNANGSTAARAYFYLSCGASNAASNRDVHCHAMGRWK